MRRLPVLAAAAALLAACGGGARPGGDSARVAVSAAASLGRVLAALVDAFAVHAPGVELALNLGGSQALAAQIVEHAPADVFAAADEPSMARVVAAGRNAAPPVVFARNRLAIAVAAGNPHGLAALADLARPGLRVALCGPQVPAGRYARTALARAGVTVPSRSDEPNVAALVAKVALGELDAGVAYATDGRDGVTLLPLPPEHDVVADYPIAVLRTGAQRAVAEGFVAFVTGGEGRAILAAHGFGLP